MSKGIKTDHFRLIKGSFSSRKYARRFPVLTGLHRIADGLLLGALITGGLMATLTLHWQHLWTLAFSRLEKTRALSHRLIDSSSMLEKQLLKNSSLPKIMVSTKAANLLYLDKPHNIFDNKKRNIYSTKLRKYTYTTIRQGY